MIYDTVIINKIIADEGMVLTNGQAYGTEIYLGKEDSALNWHEITREQYEQIMREQEEQAQKEFGII